MLSGQHYIWSFAGALLGSIITALITPVVINFTIDKIIRSLMTGTADKNSLLSYLYLYHNIPIMRILDITHRANSGMPLLKPFEHYRRTPSLDNILFNPAQLSEKPLEDSSSVDARVILGMKTELPLELKHPLLIAAPSTGLQLSHQVRSILISAANRSNLPLVISEQNFSKQEIGDMHQPIFTISDYDMLQGNLDVINQAAMIEIKLGQGATSSAACTIKREDRDVQAYLPRLYNLRSKRELGKLVKQLKKLTKGVPVALRMVNNKYLEKDLEIAVQAGIDVLILEGYEAGSIIAPAITAANFGMPLTHGIARAQAFISNNKLERQLDIVASGGIWDSADCLKLIALGARAVILDNVVLFALLGEQLTKAVPWYPLESLILEGGKKTAKLNIDEAVTGLANFIEASKHEMAIASAAMGKQKLSDINTEDLLTLDKELSSLSGILMP